MRHNLNLLAFATYWYPQVPRDAPESERGVTTHFALGKPSKKLYVFTHIGMFTFTPPPPSEKIPN